MSLEDFTKDELQVLLNSIVRSKLALEHKLEYPQAGDSADHKEYEVLCLWYVQVLNTIGKVGVREAIHNT